MIVRRQAFAFVLGSFVPLCLVFSSACRGSEGASTSCVAPDAAGGASEPPDASAIDGADASAPPAADASFDAGEIGAFCRDTIGAVRDAFAQTCCSPADRASAAFTLLDALANITIAQCSSLANARADGRVAFDPIAAQACIAHVHQLLSDAGACDALPANLDFFHDAPCVGVMKGLGQDHAATCSGAVECADGLACAGASAGDIGYCVAPEGLHQNCIEGLPLDQFHFGDHPPPCVDGTYCSEGQCVARAGEDGPCAGDRECMPGLACHLSRCGMDAPHAAGGACDREVDCEAGLYCQDLGLGLAGTCAVRKTAGQPCGGLDAAECRGVCVATSGSGKACASFCGAP